MDAYFGLFLIQVVAGPGEKVFSSELCSEFLPVKVIFEEIGNSIT